MLILHSLQSMIIVPIIFFRLCGVVVKRPPSLAGEFTKGYAYKS